MTIHLRTLIYSNKVEIANVPIYTCEECSRSEIYDEVKSGLKHLIAAIGESPEKKMLHFNDVNELAHILYILSDKEHIQSSVKEVVQERINQLLDLLLVAKSAGDEGWIKEIEQRLAQVSGHAVILMI
jgi:hypothetical protein